MEEMMLKSDDPAIYLCNKKKRSVKRPKDMSQRYYENTHPMSEMEPRISRMVIIQAVTDIVKGDKADEAAAWFKSGYGDDYETVCNLAGMEPMYVKSKVEKFLLQLI